LGLSVGALCVVAQAVGCRGDHQFAAMSSSAGDEAAAGESGEEAGEEEDSAEESGGPSIVLDVGGPESPESMGDPGVPPTCLAAYQFPSSMGCEFYGVDLDQAGLYDDDPYAIDVANPHVESNLSAVVTRRQGDVWNVVAGPVVVGPGEHHLFELPALEAFGSGHHAAASYRVESDLPIAAIQLSGVDGAIAHSSSATAMYPVSSWTSELPMLGWRTHDVVGEWAFVSVLSMQDATGVTVDTTVPVVAGPGVPSLVAGAQWQSWVDPGNILQLAAGATNGEIEQGFTGTMVRAGEEHRLSAYVAHTCAGIPDYAGDCGHMQEQISPWLAGDHFVATRMPIRDEAQPSDTMWQLLSLENDTTVWFEGTGQTEGLPGDPLELDAFEPHGIWVGGETQTDGDFQIFADGPIMVASYMVNAAANGMGAPAMVQLAPIKRHFPLHFLRLPDGFDAQVATVVRPMGSPVEVNAQLIPDDSFSPVGEYEIARVKLPAGLHRIESPAPVAVLAVGYRPGDAYAYGGAWGTPVPDYPPPQ
jgi:hypothetical protein